MTARNLVKIVLPIIVLLLAGLVYFSLVDGKVEKEKPVLKEKVWLVEVQQAIKQSLSPAITLYGRIESPETMNVAAPGGGVVEGIYVRNGALVSKGQALVKLDPRDFSSSLNQAKAD
ncbi:MAG: multidrug efflux pump subunit AcrA (membrane-fusion protein), partial [Gammaproteobacteria bacterium]